MSLYINLNKSLISTCSNFQYIDNPIFQERQYELRGVSERDETDKASKAQSNQHIAAKTVNHYELPNQLYM